MVVQHNLTAMNSNRMLGITTKNQAKATEKLSSGYKINRAADDAAGLSISEKMRKQIRGLTQASANAQDGISAVQTAEGALTEVHDMLQRMNELAVKAANGTNSKDDRDYIQNEVDQLVSEIDRVAETTKFNETYLLKGKDDGSFKTMTPVSATLGGADELANITGATGEVTIANALADGDSIKIGNITYQLVATLPATEPANTKSFKYDANDLTGMKAFVNAISAAGYADDAANISSVTLDETTKKITIYAKQNTQDLSLHVGADSSSTNKIEMSVESLTATGLGVNKLKVNGTDGVSATAAIDTIKEAIQRVSTQRSALGAIQNRLEHTINNLDNVVENTTSAESAIRDTDMASQMVKYSNNSILAQAGQSMLAQANQSNQGVMSLLQ